MPSDPKSESRIAPENPEGEAQVGNGAMPLPGEGPSRASAIKRSLGVLGPGLVTGASDDDPSGIGTYAMAGAQFGYATLWTAWITFPLMTAVQFICAKIGMVTGRGIAGVVRAHYPRPLLYTVVSALMIANTINAGADILAIAAGLNLLVPIPINAMIFPIGLAILAAQVWGSYRAIASVFKWLTLALFAYIGAALLSRPDWGEVLMGTFVPTLRFDREYLAMMVAILGTTISPYLFFWQASQEVEEERAMGRKTLRQRLGATDTEIKDKSWDVTAGMLLSNLVMYFIILASAATLHKAGITQIETATDAAEALRPLAGDAASLLMAVGLIGAGVLAVPILTGSAGYAVCEAFGWKCTLDSKPSRAKEFYIVLALATIGGLLIDYFAVKPMSALFWTAVINGFLAPPLLVMLMLISNNRKIMGKRTNTALVNALGWSATVVMFAAAIGLLVTWGQT